MIVWVAESDCYENRSIEGVYSTKEVAMALLPVASDVSSHNVRRPGGWQPVDPDNPDGCMWTNGLDWFDSCRIWPVVVVE
jgi:hypothetical protein